MDVGKRMLNYRATHNLSRRELAELMGEKKHVIDWCETGIHKPHLAKQIRLENKMKKLEEVDNV